MLDIEVNPNGFPHGDDIVVTRFAPGAKPAAKAPRWISARDLCALDFPPIKYVVPGYVAEGLTLFAGRPKLGKSWFCLEAALAVSSGGRCLGGIECDEGDVLYLGLEDNRRRLQSRITKLWELETQDRIPIPHRLHLATEWPRANEGGIEAIREWIRDHPGARLVVVDVLAMFRPTSKGRDQSAYDSDYLAIKALQGLAMETGVGIVVVHHTRKSGTEADPFEKVSGTLGLSGAADTTLILDRDGNGATLYGRGRDIEEIESAVVFDKARCRWVVQGEASEVRRTDERGSILAVLDDADEPLTPAEITIATMGKPNNVKQLLFKMTKAGEVEKVGKGRYIHPDRSDLRDNSRTPDNHDNPITAEVQTRRGEEESPVIAAMPITEAVAVIETFSGGLPSVGEIVSAPVIAVTEVIGGDGPVADNRADEARDIAGELLARARSIKPTRGEGRGRSLTPAGEALFRDALAVGLSPAAVAGLCQITRQSAEYRAKKIRAASRG